MLSPATAAAAVTMIVSEVWFVSPDTLWLAATDGACVATVTGDSALEAELPARSVGTALNACVPSARPATVKVQVPPAAAVAAPSEVAPSKIVTPAMLSPPTASALAVTVIVSEALRVTPVSVWVALTVGADVTSV